MPSDDLDHEVIETPEALFRHLYEAHGVLEALDLDAAAAPLQFWLRKHADLERAARRSVAAERPDDSQRAGGDVQPSATAASTGARSTTSGPRFRPFTDPVIEAVASALVGRGMDERSVRRGLSTYAGAGGRHGEEAVRDAFISPMLDAIAAGLTGELVGRGQGPPRRRPSSPASPGRTASESAPGGAAGRGTRPGWSGPAEPVSGGNTPGEPSGWATGSDADFMAIADILQKRRRPRRPGVKDGPARSARSDIDDDVMALANAIQQPSDGGRGDRTR